MQTCQFLLKIKGAVFEASYCGSTSLVWFNVDPATKAIFSISVTKNSCWQRFWCYFEQQNCQYCLLKLIFTQSRRILTSWVGSLNAWTTHAAHRWLTPLYACNYSSCGLVYCYCFCCCLETKVVWDLEDKCVTEFYKLINKAFSLCSVETEYVNSLFFFFHKSK